MFYLGFGRATKFKTGAGLGLLGNYEDSDDEVESNSAEAADDEQNVPVSTLDSKVADFLKEINDLDNEPEPSTKNLSKETSIQDQKTDVVAQTNDNLQDFKSECCQLT